MPASVKFFLQAWNLFLKSKLGLQLGSPGQVSKQGPPLFVSSVAGLLRFRSTLHCARLKQRSSTQSHMASVHGQVGTIIFWVTVTTPTSWSQGVTKRRDL